MTDGSGSVPPQRPCSPELDGDTSVYVRGASPVRQPYPDPPWPDYGAGLEMDYAAYYYHYPPEYGSSRQFKRRRTEKHKRKSDSTCSFFLQGSCFKVSRYLWA